MDSFAACFEIERSLFIKKQTNVANPKALHTTSNLHKSQAPRGTYDFAECVKTGTTTYFKDQCWKKHSHLKPKFLLNKMRTRGVKARLDGTPQSNSTSVTPAASILSVLAPLDITS